MATIKTERVLVLGGGYAGTLAAVRLAGRARRRAEVVLIDSKDAFVQRLRLHQVAAGMSVAEPSYAKILGRRVRFVAGTAEAIDADRGVVTFAGGKPRELGFDRLIYAVGSGTDVSAVPGVAQHAHGVADRIAARRLSHALAYASSDGAVLIVGGGLTGIEAASEIAAAYPRLKIKLLSSGPVGGWLSARARAYLSGALARLGVECIENVHVAGVEKQHACLADRTEIPFQLLVWCGGFRAPALAERSGLETDELGRLMVDRKMRCRSHPQIVGVGDAAATPPFVAGRPLRMCCHVAAPTSGRAADNVLAGIKGRVPKDLHFGYVHQPLSLGRRDGLIQFVGRDDSPRERIVTGRTAAIYKELVSASPLVSVRMERVLPGSNVWPIKEPKGGRIPAGGTQQRLTARVASDTPDAVKPEARVGD